MNGQLTAEDIHRLKRTRMLMAAAAGTWPQSRIHDTCLVVHISPHIELSLSAFEVFDVLLGNLVEINDHDVSRFEFISCKIT